jgi:hypothetical protein
MLMERWSSNWVTACNGCGRLLHEEFWTNTEHGFSPSQKDVLSVQACGCYVYHVATWNGPITRVSTPSGLHICKHRVQDLPLLGVLVTSKRDGVLGNTTLWNPTHTDLYRYAKSHHDPPQNQRNTSYIRYPCRTACDTGCLNEKKKILY